MEKKERTFELFARTCPVCGKEFFPGPEWVYKNHEGIFCSWVCLRKREKELKEAIKRYKYKPVEQLTLNGELVAEYPCSADAAAAVDCSLSNLRYACLKNLKYKGYIWRYKANDVSEM